MAGRGPRNPPSAPAPRKAAPAATPAPALAEARERIDGIDRQIQALIAERAGWARRVGTAKGKLKAAVDYYRPEREAQVLRQVLDRNDGPLSDEVLLRLFREIMSACLAQQEPLKVGFLGPEGTFSQQALRKHFGHSARGLPLASIEEVFEEVEAGHADFGVVPVENSGQGTIQSTLDMFLTSSLKICGEVELHVHQFLLSRTGGLRGKRIDREAETGGQHRAARTGVHLRQHHQQFVRAIAEDQALARQPVERGERGLELAAERVRVAVDGVEAVQRRPQRPRAGTECAFVRAQLGEGAGRPRTTQRHDVQARIVGAQAAHARLGERLEVRRHRSLQSRATG